MSTLLSRYSRERGRPQTTKRAFTLIELLVVIGLIAVLAAGIGIAMRDGTPSSALRAGQNILVSLVSSARGQAAIKQTNAMIVVDVTTGENGSSNDFLRSLQVVVERPGGTWEAVGDPMLLPEDIYIVPPDNVSGIQLAGSWPNDRKSTGFAPASAVTLSPAEADYNPFDGRQYLQFCKFSPMGKTGSSGVLLVTSGRRQGPDSVLLDNPEMIRGIMVSRYGVPTLINEAETLQHVSTVP